MTDYDSDRSGNLYRVSIPEELLSRGIGEQIALAEACVYDFMPPIIGAQFMTSDALRPSVYFYGDSCGAILDTENAYTSAAWGSLRHDDLEGALEAYKATLESSVGFVRAMQAFSGVMALNDNEVGKLDLSRFESLEGAIITRLDHSELVDLEAYRIFVREVSSNQARLKELNRSFFSGFSAHLEFKDGGPDPDLAREYIELLAHMGQFRTAARYAEMMGWKDVQLQYETLKDNEPKNTAAMNSSKARALAERDEYERRRGY